MCAGAEVISLPSCTAFFVARGEEGFLEWGGTLCMDLAAFLWLMVCGEEVSNKEDSISKPHFLSSLARGAAGDKSSTMQLLSIFCRRDAADVAWLLSSF